MAAEVLFTMNQKELVKIEILEKLKTKQIKQNEAGKILKISSRQIRRLLKEYRRYGAISIVSKKRGKPSNNRICEEDKKNILEIAKEKYVDFGPTFLSEKLAENHNIFVSYETLRNWLIEENIWVTRRRKKACIHQMRERRSCFGELVQIDGSPHAWFEGRGEKCCLLVFVDDATSKLVNLRFEESETTAGYFRTMKEYISKFGIPMAVYSDRHSIFRINMPETKHEGWTQFERAMKTLGVETICANSPQAKGRVERANNTLQDRLVKEMRLREISDIETANAYLPEFIERYNKKFAVEPKNSTDAHVRLRAGQNLDMIFSFQYDRVLSKNLELSYDNVIYQVKTEGQGYALRHARVTVCEALNGGITLIYKGRKLNYTCYKKQKKTAEIVGAKELNHRVDSIVRRVNKPSADHPWRGYQNRFAAAPAGF